MNKRLLILWAVFAALFLCSNAHAGTTWNSGTSYAWTVQGGTSSLEAISGASINPGCTARVYFVSGSTCVQYESWISGATSVADGVIYVCPNDLDSGGDGITGTTVWRLMGVTGTTVEAKHALYVENVRWDDGSGKIDGEQIADDTIDDDSIDLTDVTLADFTDDVGYLSGDTEAGTPTGTWDFTGGTINFTATDMEAALEAVLDIDALQSGVSDIFDKTGDAALIASFLVAGDNVSDLLNDAGYITTDSGATRFVADVGVANSTAAGQISFVGTNGIQTSGAASTITITSSGLLSGSTNDGAPTGTWDFTLGTITVPTPANMSEATTKLYVDLADAVTRVAYSGVTPWEEGGATVYASNSNLQFVEGADIGIAVADDGYGAKVTISYTGAGGGGSGSGVTTVDTEDVSALAATRDGATRIGIAGSGGVTTYASGETVYVSGADFWDKTNYPDMDTDSTDDATAGGAFHDGFSDFVANEHIDWTADQGATNIHAGNVVEADATALAALTDYTEAGLVSGVSLASNAKTVSFGASFQDAQTGDTIFMTIPFSMTMSGVSLISYMDAMAGVSAFKALNGFPGIDGTHNFVDISGSGSSVYSNAVSGTTAIAAGSVIIFRVAELATAGASNWTVQIHGTRD